MCVRETERERDRETETQRERQREVINFKQCICFAFQLLGGAKVCSDSYLPKPFSRKGVGNK